MSDEDHAIHPLGDWRDNFGVVLVRLPIAVAEEDAVAFAKANVL
jgi:hypothetical protein